MSTNESSDSLLGTILGVGLVGLGIWAAADGAEERRKRKAEIEEEINTLLEDGNEKEFLDKVYELSRYDWTIWEEILTPRASRDRSVAKLLTKAKSEREDWERYNPEKA